MKKYCILPVIAIALSLAVAAQNVGIGTTTPAEKLHVAGNIKADTIKPGAVKFTPNAAAGKVLTSDPAGNASWQNNNAAAVGNIGFGVWGDCSTNGNITDYNPVTDATGATDDLFGSSVSISGNYAIVGAYADDVGLNNSQGSASIYQYNGSEWLLMQKLTDATGAAGDRFGYSVSISGNYAVVGAYLDDVGANANQGSISIYQYNGSEWVLMQKITDADGAATDNFGYSVSISGNYVIVSSLLDDVVANSNQGSASVYQFNGSSWVFMVKLTDPNGNMDDGFGNSVSISNNEVIVGSPYDDVGANSNQGSASIYKYNGSSWGFIQKLTDPTGNGSDNFGISVSISGNYAIIGGHLDDDVNLNQGSAIIYQYDGNNWVQMQKLFEPNGAANDFFGISVAISGNYALVGISSDDPGGNTDKGSVNIYLRQGQGWPRLQKVVDPVGQASDEFGNATAIDGVTKRFLIGVQLYAGQSGKVIFGKVN